MYSNNNLGLESENMTISEDEDEITVIDKPSQTPSASQGVIDFKEKLYLDV